jgi:hypothetical protein
MKYGTLLLMLLFIYSIIMILGCSHKKKTLLTFAAKKIQNLQQLTLVINNWGDYYRGEFYNVNLAKLFEVVALAYAPKILIT